MVLYFVFFKQKTAYEMRISDWSSDVCSSDLSLAAIFTSRTDTGRLRIEHQTVGCHRVVAENLALEDPHLDPAHAIGGVGGRFGIVDIGAQRVQRHPAFAIPFGARDFRAAETRSEEHTSELQSLMRNSYAALCFDKKNSSHTYEY